MQFREIVSNVTHFGLFEQAYSLASAMIHMQMWEGLGKKCALFSVPTIQHVRKRLIEEQVSVSAFVSNNRAKDVSSDACLRNRTLIICIPSSFA